MNPRVYSVIPRSNYKLEIQFTNQEVRIYDCSSFLDFGVFQELRDETYFRKVKVFNGTVTWPNEQDICPDTLYLDSIPLPIAAQPLSA
jgi:hypothetical protein